MGRLLLFARSRTDVLFDVDKATLKPGESAELKSPFGHTYRFTHLGISQYEALNRVVLPRRPRSVGQTAAMLVKPGGRGSECSTRSRWVGRVSAM